MSVEFKDYYQTLGVSKTATREEVRTAFRKLARTHHPDVAKDKKTAEAKFKEINEAYEVLGDPEKRRKYDSLGAGWDKGPAPGQGQDWRGGTAAQGGGPMPEFFGGAGFSDFFERFFAGGGRGGVGRGGGGGGGFGGFNGEQRGGDAEVDFLVTIEEALQGARKNFSLRRGGSNTPENYEVKVPAGVREGQRIRLAGRGRPGERGGAAGDLYLRVRLAQHPDYTLEGADIVREVEIASWRAVLGTEAEVTTPEGPVRLRIPSGSQPGRKFRIKGRGMPMADGQRGDFYVQLQVSLPETLGVAEREAWEALARVSGER